MILAFFALLYIWTGMRRKITVLYINIEGNAQADRMNRDVANYTGSTETFQICRRIVDLSTTSDSQLHSILNLYYNSLDVKYFIGFSSSEMLNRAKRFFTDHPDTVCISIGSTSISLSKPDNIYRFIPNDSLYIDGFKELVRSMNYTRQKFIIFYDKGDLWATDFSSSLYSVYPNATLYPIDCSTEHLSQSDLDTVSSAIGNSDADTIFFTLFYLSTGKFFGDTYMQWYRYPRQIFGGDGSAFTVFPSVVNAALDRCNYVCATPFMEITSQTGSRKLQKLSLGKGDRTEFYALVLDDVLGCIESIEHSPKWTNLIDYTKNVIGLTGPLKLDSNGDRIFGNCLFVRYRAGMWNPVAVYGKHSVFGKETKMFGTLE